MYCSCILDTVQLQGIHFTVRFLTKSAALFPKSGIRFHLSPVQLLYCPPIRGHLWGAGGVWLDSLFCGVHASPWLPRFSVGGGGADGRLVHRLGEEECGDPERDWRPWGVTHAQAAEGERGAGETGGREGEKGGGKGRKCCKYHWGPPFSQVASQLFPSFFVSPSVPPHLSLPSLLYPSVLLFPSHLLRHKEFNGATKTTSQVDLLAGCHCTKSYGSAKCWRS